MLKFSGYPYLIRGQSWYVYGGLSGGSTWTTRRNEMFYFAGRSKGLARCFSGAPDRAAPITERGSRGVMTLEQACPPEYQGAQCAFKDSMIH